MNSSFLLRPGKRDSSCLWFPVICLANSLKDFRVLYNVSICVKIGTITNDPREIINAL
jgi:hypothetical protein